jgi:hypothetical protein
MPLDITAVTATARSPRWVWAAAGDDVDHEFLYVGCHRGRDSKFGCFKGGTRLSHSWSRRWLGRVVAANRRFSATAAGRLPGSISVDRGEDRPDRLRPCRAPPVPRLLAAIVGAIDEIGRTRSIVGCSTCAAARSTSIRIDSPGTVTQSTAQRPSVSLRGERTCSGRAPKAASLGATSRSSGTRSSPRTSFGGPLAERSAPASRRSWSTPTTFWVMRVGHWRRRCTAARSRSVSWPVASGRASRLAAATASRWRS